MKVVKEAKSMLSKSLLPCLAPNLLKVRSSSSGSSSISLDLSTAANSSLVRVPSPDLSKCLKTASNSAFCSGEMSACARVIWLCRRVILSRSSFSSTSTCVFSEATLSRVYGLSSSPASTNQSLSSCAGARRPCRRSRWAVEVRASRAARTSWPLAIEAGSSVTEVVVEASVSTSAFSAATLAATSATASAKLRFFASNSFCDANTDASRSPRVATASVTLTMAACSVERGKRQ
mmetsp:Transcript_5793/g.11398  ORF Transcript_5793/g.11398 Transcript_5793/m.11398 type:complete len:234 (-) Transcript_5793:2215-2916(-)